jgi:hypothetical protein
VNDSSSRWSFNAATKKRTTWSGESNDDSSFSVYRGGVQVLTDRQTTDWGSFFKSGRQGLTRYDPGQGNLDPACHTVTFAPGSKAGQRSTCAGPPL